MLPTKTRGATHALGAPKNWDEKTMGTCGVLSVRVQGGQGGVTECVSTWKPSLEEINMLQEGGAVILTVSGWQPAVSLHVEIEEEVQDEPEKKFTQDGTPLPIKP
jgi:hypothetical protein